MGSRETHITLTLPADIAAHLAAQGDLSRAALEGLALEAYREGNLTSGQIQRLLGFRTRIQVHAFLKEHGVFLHYGSEDLEHDRQAGDALSIPPRA
jgi:predicted HTH domain antitoxin